MKNQKIRILFVCIANSFRSQIAEAIMNHKYGDVFEAESSGYKVKPINPLAIEVMQEYGVDISNKKSNKVIDFFKEGRTYKYVITVCNRSEEQDCPIFPGMVTRLSWGDLEDPEYFTGSQQEKKEMALILRDKIEKRIDDFVNTMKES